MMRSNYRDDGAIWFDDQICEKADLLITVRGVRFIYMKKQDRSWIERVGDDGLRSALRQMSETQLRMIEELIFEDKTVADIEIGMHLTVTEIRIEMRDMRRTLLMAM